MEKTCNKQVDAPGANATVLNSQTLTSPASSRDAKRQKFSHGPPLCVELFAGKATLSRALIQSGFEVLSIDHVSDSPMAPIVVLDLTTSSGQTILWEILASDRLFSAHLGLPCGTSSKARERPVPERLRRMGVPSPKPLRSAEYPMGVPQLSELDRLKVEKANVLYQLGLEVVLYLTKRGIIVSVENPFGSWLWAVFIRLTLTKSLEDKRIYNSLEMVQFHSCCHGSKRRKDTGWLSTPGVYTELNAVCQNDHPHEPWGVSWQFGQWRFDTSTESAYPTLLAQRAAACLVKRATSDGLTLHPCVRLHDLATASTGKQTKKHKPLILEYHHFSTQAKNLPIPDGAKILAPHLGGVSEEVASTNDISSADKLKLADQNKCPDDKLKLADQNKLGHFHSPKQFISRAKVAQHPMDSTEHLEDATLFSIQYNLQHSHELIKLERKKNLLQAKLLAKQLESDERKLHESLNGSMQKVLDGKRLLLWKQLLIKYNYDDMAVCDFMFKGVPVVGCHDTPSCYPELLKPATLTESDLQTSAVWRRKAILSKVHQADPSHIDHLLEATQEELDLGFLEGPFHTEHEVSSFLGRDDWSVIRRFVLVQGAEMKLRPIDDCLEAQLNFAYTSSSYLKLQDVDYIAGLALRLADAVQKGKQSAGSGEWLGKCLDLSKAYKQLAVLPEHRYLAVIFFHDHDGQPRFYVANSLMFGSTAAVYSFNRVSRSLWFLLNKMLLIPCGVFYDDFPMFSPSELAEDADASASLLLDMLGWRHARTGPKGKPFANTFQVLGCQLDLRHLAHGKIVLENKQGRLERIFNQLEAIRSRGCMSLHESQVLHGLLRYSSGFFSGRHLQQVCLELVQLGVSRGLQTGGRLEEFCIYAEKALSACQPKVLSASDEKRPILIFTDASWESGHGGLGAVVIDLSTHDRFVFSGEIPSVLRDIWVRQLGDHIICQLELYVMVAIRWRLKRLLSGRRVIWWVDNDAARFALIKGQSLSHSMNLLVRKFFDADASDSSFGWIERVPSYSNVADYPSRGKPELACELLGLESSETFLHPDDLVASLVEESAGRKKGLES